MQKTISISKSNYNLKNQYQKAISKSISKSINNQP